MSEDGCRYNYLNMFTAILFVEEKCNGKMCVVERESYFLLKI